MGTKLWANGVGNQGDICPQLPFGKAGLSVAEIGYGPRGSQQTPFRACLFFRLRYQKHIAWWWPFALSESHRVADSRPLPLVALPSILLHSLSLPRHAQGPTAEHGRQLGNGRMRFLHVPTNNPSQHLQY